jgi:hypothetical protein
VPLAEAFHELVMAEPAGRVVLTVQPLIAAGPAVTVNVAVYPPDHWLRETDTEQLTPDGGVVVGGWVVGGWVVGGAVVGGAVVGGVVVGGVVVGGAVVGGGLLGGVPGAPV